MKKAVREMLDAMKAIAEGEGITLLHCEKRRSGHHHLRWRRADGSEFKHILPSTPSCPRTGLNTLSDFKRAAKKL